MSLTLTVLGCDGSYPGPGGACSGYLVQGGEVRIWLDAGSGTLSSLQRHIAIRDLDAVVLSHEHPDHWSDLEGLRVAWSYCPHAGQPPLEQRGPVQVYAPAGLRRHLYDPDSGPLVWRDISDRDRVTVKDLSLTFSRTDHGPETLAVRIDRDGSSLGYSADSGPGWSLEALGSGLDLVLCEATFTKLDEGRLQHMSARQAGASGRAARARSLVLTHLWPSVARHDVYEEGSEAFGEAVELAEPGWERTI